jgi:hypothetical protein
MRIQNRRRAFARGEPRIAAELGTASSFIFDQGVLCWITQGSRYINVMDTWRNGTPVEIHVSEILGESMFDYDDNTFQLLNYSDGIISVLYEEDADAQQWLLIAEVPLDNNTFARALRSTPLQDSTMLFVRNTAEFLYYGTHSYYGSHGNREWVLQGISLRNERPFPPRSQSIRAKGAAYESMKVHLTDFVGDQIGTTAAFVIHDGYFVAVTNTDDFDAVEVDWTSFYHCFKFPVHDPHKDNVRVNHGLFRRQHREGPMHDGWLTLNLQVDERTNELLIVETRKEWLMGKSNARRTAYVTKVEFELAQAGEIGAEAVSTGYRGAAPENDQFSIYVTSSSKWKLEEKRLHWQFHPEEFNLRSSTGYSKSAESPLLAHTKYQTYDVASKTFIDLVVDFSCCSHISKPSRRHGCLRLRTCSRQYRPPCDMRNMSPSDFSPQEWVKHPGPFTYTPVSLWPPPAESSHYANNAHVLMSPEIDEFGPARHSDNISGLDVNAASDERTLVLLIRASASDANGKLICLGFDSQAASKHWNDLGVPPPRPKRRIPEQDRKLPEKTPERKDSLMEEDEKQSDTQCQDSVPSSEAIAVPSQHTSTEDAMDVDFSSSDVEGLRSQDKISKSWVDIWDMNTKEHQNGETQTDDESDCIMSDDLDEFIDFDGLFC